MKIVTKTNSNIKKLLFLENTQWRSSVYSISKVKLKKKNFNFLKFKITKKKHEKTLLFNKLILKAIKVKYLNSNYGSLLHFCFKK